MEFQGNWVVHPQYGDQFKAIKATERKPASAAGLQKYLGSGLIKGVGPKTARKIVRHFGKRTLDVFEESIEELLHVPGIAEKKLAHISSSWQQHRAIRDVMIFLQSHDVSTLFAVKIFKTYGEKSIEVVSENPYCLARDIYGIGFFSADRIALKLGFEKNGEQRIKAGIKHVLASSRDQGHCYLDKAQICDETNTLLELSDQALILQSLHQLLQADEIKQRRIIIEQEQINCYYANALYWDETYVAERINQLVSQPVVVDPGRIKTWMARYCKKHQVQLSDEQAQSIRFISGTPFSVLTGGPGCGKTTTTRVLVKLLKAMNKRICLAAPTGRAAQRMTEVIGEQAKTIHRLLEWEPHRGGFNKTQEQPLEADFLIVDECSMLDISLTAALLKAVSNHCQVLFIGDPDQLPSVGAGAVLQDLLSSPCVPHCRLTKIFRQAQQSLIIQHAHEINKGIIPKIISPLAHPNAWRQHTDCLFIDSQQATQEQLQFIGRAKKVIAQTLEDGQSKMLHTEDDVIGRLSKVDEQIQFEALYCPKPDDSELNNRSMFTIPKKFKHVNWEQLSTASSELDELRQVLKSIHPWSSLNHGLTALDTILRLYTKTIKARLGDNCEIQILTPQIRGSLGTANLNRDIQQAVNPARDGRIQLQMGERHFRVNDRVIQTRNNYDLNVFNGDIGRIVSIDPDDYSTEIEFGDQARSVIYTKDTLTEISLAYAITIHKSQGSEFDAVIIPVTTQHFKMLFRSLIYTGLTRAKKLAIFVGSRQALALAVKSIDNLKRQTALNYLLLQS